MSGKPSVGDVMGYPPTWRDFVGSYSFADRGEVYTNGSELVPVFRVEDMVEHYFGRAAAPTCRMEASGCAFDRCTRCGALVRRDCAADATGVVPARYCPNCGAVVEPWAGRR